MNDDRTAAVVARPPDEESAADAAWGIFGYLLAGLLLYGGLGWLVGALIHQVALCATVGVVVGIVLATTMVFFRYGKLGAAVPVRQRSVSLRSVLPDAAARTARSATDPGSVGARDDKPKAHVIDRRQTKHAS